MSEQKDGGSGFDRDQMNALLGGGFSERLLRQKGAATEQAGTTLGGTGGRTDKQKEKDVSDMTIQETAAYLRQQQKGQQQQKQQQTASSLAAQPRHRVVGTGKVRQYHQLLSEQQEQETAVAPVAPAVASSSAVASARYDSEDDYDGNHNHTMPEAQEFVRPTRTKAAPKVVTSKAKDTTATSASATVGQARVPRKRRYDSDSSNSNSSEESDDAAAAAKQQPQRRRRRADSSSSSEDSDEGISRRQRLLKQRNTTGTNETTGVFVAVPGDELTSPTISNEKTDEKKVQPPKDGDNKRNRHDDDTSESDTAAPNKVVAKPAVVVKAKQGEESGSGSSSSEEESSGSSSSSSDDDDDDIAPMAKPLFVPKHKRGSVQTAADSTAAAAAAEEKVIEANARRLRESRAMVQQVVTAEATKQPDYDTALEGITGARNAMPDDRDDELDNANNNDDDTAQDVWEVRELARLLADWDLEVARRDDERELARRRSLTDDQKLQEDMASGRYQRPGSRPDEGANTSGGMQRYYHKGAYYMDESEWNESDVRHKAAEYAKAATGSDKVDRRKLPDIMKVKNFGFANQSKYKGMAAEVS
jgi:microfibrillar-associated protein 1